MVMIAKPPLKKDLEKTDPVRQWVETRKGRIYCEDCFKAKYGFIPR